MPNFGAGVLAAMVGCRLVPREETIWFEPERVVASPDLSIGSETDSPVARRIADFYAAAIEFWGESVQLTDTR